MMKIFYCLVFPLRALGHAYNESLIRYFGDGRAATFMFIWTFPVLVLFIYCGLIYIVYRMQCGFRMRRREFLLKDETAFELAGLKVRRGFESIAGGMGLLVGQAKVCLMDDRGEISYGCNNLWKILEEIRPDSVALIGHIKPDGDCVAACAAMQAYLRLLCPEAEIDIILDEASKNVEKVLPGVSGRKRMRDRYTVAFILDVDDKRLTEEGAEAYTGADHRFCIDHHRTNTAADTAEFCLVDCEASSACEILYRLFKSGPVQITPRIAKMLFVGLMTDTGGLRYRSTSAETYRCAADLKEIGQLEQQDIIEQLFYENKRSVLVMTAEAVATSKAVLGGKVVIAETPWFMAKECGLTVTDSGKVPGELLYDEDALASIYFFEMEPGSFSCSLRSKGNIDMSSIAKSVGGGGHKNAAGFRFKAGDTTEMRKYLVSKIKEVI